jgi:hypothetical protein
VGSIITTNTDIPYEYVIFKPLSQVDIAKEKPEIVVFYVNTDQLSALTVRPMIEPDMMSFSVPYRCFWRWMKMLKEVS